MLAVLISGVASLSIAAVLSFSTMSKMVERMVSLSVGVMLSTTFLHALPEAFEMTHDPVGLFATVLGGLLGFFLLEKFSVLRHSHHHEGDGHDHEAGHDKREAGSTGWMILVGDGFHNFTDGIMIAAAFMADVQLGVITALAIFAHEIPQEVGDFIVLLNAGFSRTRAYVYNLLCSLLAVVGGLVGYYTLEQVQSLIPYVLALASAGFIYIAVSDLIPQMQRRTSIRETIPQIILITVGVAIIFVITSSMHGHAH
ncbi:ZIP family metal transporter [Oxalobacter vibrioformis]|uniref:ZIP family metal transporter n=1 Tax=Oxalobacter vibrioformis TaxID=933080 RepID=A0A9E9LZI3_9BURK|nr:ZIP family metal transporter [Oxalobacter vibrioformis]WAW11336.1 ZIP family metal transporter [Oxalobacter vibrioformis]